MKDKRVSITYWWGLLKWQVKVFIWVWAFGFITLFHPTNFKLSVLCITRVCHTFPKDENLWSNVLNHRKWNDNWERVEPCLAWDCRGEGAGSYLSDEMLKLLITKEGWFVGTSCTSIACACISIDRCKITLGIIKWLIHINLTSSIKCLSSWSVRKEGLYEPSCVVLPVPTTKYVIQ